MTSWINIEKTWTDEEVEALVEELKKEKNIAIDKAVQEATIPILAKNYSLEYELSFYKENWKEVENLTNKYLKTRLIGGISICILSFFAGYGISQIMGK